MAVEQLEAIASAERPIDFSVVVPCFRDEKSLDALFSRVGKVMDELPGTAELVIVDDGSPDRTGERAVELSAHFPHRVVVVRLMRNFGQHPAVFAGLAQSRGQVVITMDSDLQYPPEEIPSLVENLSPEFPVVSGFREGRRDPFMRRMITKSISWWLSRRTGTKLRDFGSMFRAYDRTVVDRMLAFTERHRFVPAVVAWLGVPIKEQPVKHHARATQSRYRINSLVEMMLDLVTGYTVFPLRVITALGLIGSVVGFICTMFFIVYRFIIGAGIGGTVSAFALVFFLSGTQLLILALLGEYVGRIYTESKARPYFVIGDVITSTPENTVSVAAARN